MNHPDEWTLLKINCNYIGAYENLQIQSVLKPAY